jgi:transposase
MSKKNRRHITPEQKAELLRRHIVDKQQVSDICNEAKIQPSMFYQWQRDLLAAAPTVFSTRRSPNKEHAFEQKIASLEAKLARKDTIIADVSEEYVKLKKELGEL